MKQLFVLIVMLLAFYASADVPQFSYNSFADWVYTNPNVELNNSNIKANRIYLYKTSTGLNLTLTSPVFSCRPGEVIDMDITWITDQWQDQGFVVSKVALTATLIDGNGNAVDSVTYNPASVERTNQVSLSIRVPQGMNDARLRFAAWKADVNSCGAVRQIAMTVSSSGDTPLDGDVNLDGEVSITDINAVISVILGRGGADEGLNKRADVNGDGEVTISDINAVINIIFGRA